MSKTIKEVLEELVYKISTDDCQPLLRGEVSYVDQALLEIQEIIKECKPDFIAKQGTSEYYYELDAIKNYQSNLEKRLK